MGYRGESLKRVEDERFLKGQARYVDDLKLTDVLHAAFVRSTYGHARILRIETSVASQMPGVRAVCTAADLPDLRPLPARLAVEEGRLVRATPLASERVRFVGEPLAVVVAETGAQAEDAARAVEVEYDPLPAVTRAEEALAPGAPRLHVELPDNLCYRVVRSGGEVERVFERAAHLVSVRVENHRIAPVPLEPRAIVARPEPDGTLTVWASSQAPYRMREWLTAALGTSSDRIRVIAPDVGGGFGAKGPAYREDAVVAALALRLGRPVKWTATRSEDFLTMQHARDQVNEATAALDSEGRILALRTKTITNLGAYVHHVNTLAPLHLVSYGTGAYRIPAHQAEVLTVFTNTAPTGPYRGAGRPEAAFLIERLMDKAARRLGLDPTEIRLRNAVPPEAFPYTAPTGSTYDSGNYPALLRKVLELAGYETLLRERRERRSRGELVGIGLALFVEPTAAGWESAAVRVESDGRVIGLTGSHSHGQGHETSFAQVLADELGVLLEQVSIRHGDTASLPAGVGTNGSRSTVLGGGALVEAARIVKERLRKEAAHLLEAAPEDVEPADGMWRVRGAPWRAVPLVHVAAAAYARAIPERPLEAYAVFEAPYPPISSGAYLALVSVEAETGLVKLERLVAVDDCGTIINPLLVEGQVHGGVAQGIGQALLERLVYDEHGQALTASLLDYAVPCASDIPSLVTGHTVTPSPTNPLGAKGMGEAGAIGAPPAIVNAVLDALAPLGVEDLDMPLHPEKVWRAIQASRQAQPGKQPGTPPR